MAAGNLVAASDIPARTIGKVRTHIIPLLFLLYIVAYLDRINIGFAALTMNTALAITSAQFGLLTGIFFWGYVLSSKSPAIFCCTKSARAFGLLAS